MTASGLVLNKLFDYICALSPISFVVSVLAVISCIAIGSIETGLDAPEFETLSHKHWMLDVPFIEAIVAYILSLITCGSAVYGLYKEGGQKKDIYSLFVKETSHALVVTRCIFWMSLWDSMINLWIIVCWALPLFGNRLYSELPSIVLGMVGQTSFTASINWYLIITLLLIVSICCSVEQQTMWFHKIQLLGYILFILIVLFPVLLVIIFDNNGIRVFGYVIDSNTMIECWIRNESKQYWWNLYGLVVIAMLLSILLSIICIFRLCKKCDRNDKEFNITCKLLAFVLVFLCSWIWPAMERATSDPPFWLAVCHHVFMPMYGLGNAVVWFTLQFYGQYKNSQDDTILTTLMSSTLHGETANNSSITVSQMYQTSEDTSINESTNNYSHMDSQDQPIQIEHEPVENNNSSGASTPLNMEMQSSENSIEHESVNNHSHLNSQEQAEIIYQK